MIQVTDEKFKDYLRSNIADGNAVTLVLDRLYDDSENRLEMVIQQITDKYDNGDLASTIYTCAKELVVNGMKANAKRVFFHEHQLDIYKESDYHAGMVQFREIVQNGELNGFIQKALDQGLYVEVVFQHSAKGMRITVKNNVKLSPIEARNIETRLQKAVQYDDIAQFYMDSVDAMSEGSGMGITMIVLMMKGHDFSTDNFRIESENDHVTAAILEFPFPV